MISSLAWIPKGAAKSEPEYADFVVDDIEALKAAAYAEGQPPSGVSLIVFRYLWAFCSPKSVLRNELLRHLTTTMYIFHHNYKKIINIMHAGRNRFGERA